MTRPVSTKSMSPSINEHQKKSPYKKGGQQQNKSPFRRSGQQMQKSPLHKGSQEMQKSPFKKGGQQNKQSPGQRKKDQEDEDSDDDEESDEDIGDFDFGEEDVGESEDEESDNDDEDVPEKEVVNGHLKGSAPESSDEEESPERVIAEGSSDEEDLAAESSEGDDDDSDNEETDDEETDDEDMTGKEAIAVPVNRHQKRSAPESDSDEDEGGSDEEELPAKRAKGEEECLDENGLAAVQPKPPSTRSTGLADVFNKILNQKVKAEDMILCFAKTDRQKAEDDSSDEEAGMSARQRFINRLWRKEAYAKPLAVAGVRSIVGRLGGKASTAPADVVDSERAREIRLCAEARRGVVRLFNTVKQQQAAVEKRLRESGSTEGKREKVMASLSTGDFLDRLSKRKKVE